MSLSIGNELLFINCLSEGTWLAVCRDIRKLKDLAVGVKAVVIRHPDHNDLYIEIDSDVAA